MKYFLGNVVGEKSFTSGRELRFCLGIIWTLSNDDNDSDNDDGSENINKKK